MSVPLPQPCGGTARAEVWPIRGGTAGAGAGWAGFPATALARRAPAWEEPPPSPSLAAGELGTAPENSGVPGDDLGS
ncbi:MAG TPA: hypothetical protein VMV69_11710 [Pirellulales bacterium]|nr:hypothetical protein [Pirellulales bacterium]